jgi:stage III sporulation protein AC
VDEFLEGKMEIELLLKVCGVALVVAFVCHVLNKTGKDEQSMVVSLLGTVLILILLAQKIGVLISTLREIFGI